MLNEEELKRYTRQIKMSEVGIDGQEKLSKAKVLVVGAGGLGSPVLIYLTGAGVGCLGIVDGDVVDIHNLHRQIIHPTKNIGILKTKSASETLMAINPNILINQYPVFLNQNNIDEILFEYDVVVNAIDNFETRHLVNTACVKNKKPLVDASIFKFSGQATVYMPGKGCYRCLYPHTASNDIVPTSVESGILGAPPGLLGVLQAVEVLKILLGIGDPLTCRLLLINFLTGTFKTVKWEKDINCPICG